MARPRGLAGPDGPGLWAGADALTEGHHVAAGGVRRALLGLLVGVGVGLLAERSMPPSPPPARTP
jgi:hypothetical protein